MGGGETQPAVLPRAGGEEEEGEFVVLNTEDAAFALVKDEEGSTASLGGSSSQQQPQQSSSWWGSWWGGGAEAQAAAEKEKRIGYAWGPPEMYAYGTAHIPGTEEDLVVNEDNCEKVVEDIKLLIRDIRLLVADSMLSKLEAWLQEGEQEEDGEDTPRGRVRRELAKEETRQKFDRLKERAALCRVTVADMESGDNWEHASTYWGISTYYRMTRTADGADDALMVKMTGDLEDCSVMDQICVMREGDMYKKWVPLISRSFVLKENEKESVAYHYNIQFPLIGARDAVVEIFACDHAEENFLVFCGKSITEETATPGVVVPPMPTGFNVDRLQIEDFRCELRLTSAMHYTINIITTFKIRSSILARIVHFGVKLWGGLLPYWLHRQALKVCKDPANNMHAKRMREHPVYSDFFIPRMVALAKYKNWPLIGTTAHEVSGDTSKATLMWKQALEEVAASREKVPVAGEAKEDEATATTASE